MRPAEIHPGILHARVEPERDRRAECKGRVFAEIIVGRGVAHFDRAVLHRVGGGKTGHDLACGEHLDLELVVGSVCYRFGKNFRRAIESVERFRETRGQPPLELGHGLGDGGLRNRGGSCSEAGRLEKIATFHGRLQQG